MPYPEVICGACATSLKRIEAPMCSKCGAPFPTHWLVEVCPECRMHVSSITRIRSVYYYENLIQGMIVEVKYARRARYLRYLAKELATTVRTSFPSSIQAIVPVPLHRQRQWERTFNQAELLANQMSRFLNIPVWKTLQKHSKTPPQSLLSGTARRANLKGAFRCINDKIPRRSVLLIDDVITTGATLEECARVLRRSAGVKRVYAITIARAVQQF